jgi:hypothetical protein
MWEQSVDNLIAAFADDKDAKVLPHRDTASIIFDKTVLLRCKKASIQLFTKNYPTPLAVSFHIHEADLFGYYGLQRVELAHVFNRFETALDWIGVVARSRRKILWYFPLDESGAGSVEGLPLPEPDAPAGDRVLRPIKPEDTKPEENASDKGE